MTYGRLGRRVAFGHPVQTLSFGNIAPQHPLTYGIMTGPEVFKDVTATAK